MEDLKVAAQTYEAEITALRQILAADAQDGEALELLEQLEAALRETRQLLHSADPEEEGERPQVGPTQPPDSVPPLADVPRTPPLPLLFKQDANTRMHPQNRFYMHEPDYSALAGKYPELSPFIHEGASGRTSLDFSSWDATRALNRVLLQEYYHIRDWEVPHPHLIPPVANRANYLHWIDDLLHLSSPPGALVRGLDIGCGANFIYCLLGASIFGYHMVGVDVTDAALESALANCSRQDHLEHLLEVRRSRVEGPSSKGIISGALKDDQEVFHFTMCNPPFFDKMTEAGRNPWTECGGTASEMVYPGGEMAFVMAMVEDSSALRGRVHWYTTMVGKKETLKKVRGSLHRLGVTALRTTELAQGRTSRWAVAWSFDVNPNLANVPLRQHPKRPQGAPWGSSQCVFELLGVGVTVAADALAKVMSARGATCTSTASDDGVMMLVELSGQLPDERDRKRQRLGEVGTQEARRSSTQVKLHVREVSDSTHVILLLTGDFDEDQSDVLVDYMKRVEDDVRYLVA